MLRKRATLLPLLKWLGTFLVINTFGVHRRLIA